MSAAEPVSPPAPRTAAVIAEVVRSGFVEGHHYGSWVVLAPSGEVLASAGEVTRQVLPRSCNKPLQAVGMLSAGLSLSGRLLAVACASHSGETFHVEAVREVLAGAGLTEEALQTPMDWPIDETVRDELIRVGRHKEPVLMNCSGKHAAMLATCVANGWDTATYLAPDHPLQQAIAGAFAELTGEPVEHVAVDGCGAPLLSTSLVGLARGFSRVALRSGGALRPLDTHAAAVAAAIREHPEYVSGTRRDELQLHRAVPGLIAKAGAEGCYAAALPDGTAIAIKTDDGAARPRAGLMAALVEKYAGTPGIDVAALRRTGETPVLGGGLPVGEVRPVVEPD